MKLHVTRRPIPSDIVRLDVDVSLMKASPLATFTTNSSDRVRAPLSWLAGGALLWSSLTTPSPTSHVGTGTQGNYTKVMERLEARSVRNDVIIPGVDQAALKKKLVRTGNAFFRRNADRNAPVAKLSPLVRSRHAPRLCIAPTLP